MTTSEAYKGYEISPSRSIENEWDVVDIWEILFTGPFNECKEYIDEKIDGEGHGF